MQRPISQRTLLFPRLQGFSLNSEAEDQQVKKSGFFFLMTFITQLKLACLPKKSCQLPLPLPPNVSCWDECVCHKKVASYPSTQMYPVSIFFLSQWPLACYVNPEFCCKNQKCSIYCWGQIYEWPLWRRYSLTEDEIWGKCLMSTVILMSILMSNLRRKIQISNGSRTAQVQLNCQISVQEQHVSSMMPQYNNNINIIGRKFESESKFNVKR
jgi:hypothetical protein